MAESSDDDIVAVAYILQKCEERKEKRKLRRFVWVRRWIEKREQHGTYHGLVRELAFSDLPAYKNFLRMDSESVLLLVQKVGPLICRTNTVLRNCISVEDRLTITLRFLATGKVIKSNLYLFMFLPIGLPHKPNFQC